MNAADFCMVTVEWPTVLRVPFHEEWDTDEQYPAFERCELISAHYRPGPYTRPGDAYTVGIPDHATVRRADGTVAETDSLEPWIEYGPVLAVSRVRTTKRRETSPFPPYEVRTNATKHRVVTIATSAGPIEHQTSADDVDGSEALRAVIRYQDSGRY